MVPLPNGHVLAEINGGDPNHFTSTKMILKKNLGFLLIVLCFFGGRGHGKRFLFVSSAFNKKGGGNKYMAQFVSIEVVVFVVFDGFLKSWHQTGKAF